jgi:Co/Zn/Cd efflux system component
LKKSADNVDQEWAVVVMVTEAVVVMVVQTWTAWERLQRFLHQQEHQLNLKF